MSYGVPPPPLAILTTDDPPEAFPAADCALQSPDGLLALGGDLSIPRLLYAYAHGIFPWFDTGQPILWWSPNPRQVISPEHIHVSKSLRRALNKNPFRYAWDTNFTGVIEGCAAPRAYSNDTWITQEMREAYIALHKAGHAHSFEVYRSDDDRAAPDLIGGIYGIAIGQVFFGESMFHNVPNASKAVLVALCQKLKQWNYQVLDCQVVSNHLESMGAERVPRQQFLSLLDCYCTTHPSIESWKPL